MHQSELNRNTENTINMNKLVFAVFLAVALFSSYTSAVRIVCNRPNEEYQCGSACQTECKTLGEPCRIVNIDCNHGCYCVKGYARDASGTCIPISKCPPKSKNHCGGKGRGRGRWQ